MRMVMRMVMRKRMGNMWGKLKIGNQMVKEHTHILMGKWKGGSPWIGTKYNKNGKILGKWVNGKFQ